MLDGGSEMAKTKHVKKIKPVSAKPAESDTLTWPNGCIPIK
jgi:hypothetical protein